MAVYEILKFFFFFQKIVHEISQLSMNSNFRGIVRGQSYSVKSINILNFFLHVFFKYRIFIYEREFLKNDF
jgi:hypothetical protein